MLKKCIFWIVACWIPVVSFGQAGLVFNKTEFDFEDLAPSNVPFEHDFLFRNTSDEEMHILGVRSIHSALSFIYTRSEVLPGEYGFVKVKLRTDSLEGLFHDEVYLTLQQGNEVVSEVLYLRARITADGRRDMGRSFQDSEIATSVEVSPEDIEQMEGLTGRDRLTAAESENAYLRKQVALKSDLIARLSVDLQQKKEEERENLKRLASLEASIRAEGQMDQQDVLAQIDQLAQRLMEIQASDSLLRKEIHEQEAVYERLRHEADSARQYAEDLSIRLQNQFKLEAEAMERNRQLEEDLRSREILEARQRRQIDSLQNIVASGASNADVQAEIDRLKEELSLRQREQDLQAEHAQKQHMRIEELKAQQQHLSARTDSLSQSLEEQQSENQGLQDQLNLSLTRMAAYQHRIDSMKTISAGQIDASVSEAEIARLQGELDVMASHDAILKAEISKKNEELSRLNAEKQQSEKDLKALENASNRQVEEWQSLMYRINALSARESQARMEVADLEARLKNAHMSNELAFTELKSDVDAMREERDMYRTKWMEAEKKLRLYESGEPLSSGVPSDSGQSMVDTPSPVSDFSTPSIRDDVTYYVCFEQLHKPMRKPGSYASLHAYGEVVHYREGTDYAYAIGFWKTMPEAMQHRELLIKEGYKDARIVAFYQGHIISLKEATRLGQSGAG